MNNSCAVCNESTNYFNRRKISDDKVVCQNCLKRAKNLSLKQLAFLKNVTAEEIKKSILESNNKGDELLSFKATKSIGNFVQFDDTNEKWLIPSKGNFIPTPDLIFNYSDIVDFELLENGETVASGGLGRALVGGALFGGVGAIVGGITGKRKNKGVCSSLRLKITINDINNPVVYIDFIESKTKKSSNYYKLISQQAQECLSVFQLICEKQKDNSTNNSSLSLADELLKFKELLDVGAITKEEYEKKKEEILKQK